ncbi:hypothetical protein [Sphaerospermopsis reniformis]|uniref:hypothetical protein n=1 Tax=Sphaerospermopsis reniformis TaxID=531300 RepID=UPI001396CA9C|nr:hypothetical protein [Sphaerospermopsis reniformis]
MGNIKLITQSPVTSPQSPVPSPQSPVPGHQAAVSRAYATHPGLNNQYASPYHPNTVTQH